MVLPIVEFPCTSPLEKDILALIPHAAKELLDHEVLIVQASKFSLDGQLSAGFTGLEQKRRAFLIVDHLTF